MQTSPIIEQFIRDRGKASMNFGITTFRGPVIAAIRSFADAYIRSPRSEDNKAAYRGQLQGSKVPDEVIQAAIDFDPPLPGPWSPTLFSNMPTQE